MATKRRRTASSNPEDRFVKQIAEARNGSAEALGELLQGCRRYLLLWANRALESTLRPKEGASDMVQKTFVIAHRDFQTFRGATIGELLAWLHQILEHQLANQVRFYKQTLKRSVRREISLDVGDHAENLGLADGQASPVDNAALADEQRRVRTAIAGLSSDDRRVLQLRTWQRLPFAEIGAQMDRTAGAAEKLWLRAVERLQAELRKVR